MTLNSDALRLSMFGSLAEIERIRQTQRSRLYHDVFGAMNYAAQQSLRAGHTVVYDAQQTKRRDRLGVEQLAQQTGAIPVVVWMKTDPAVALRRGQERESRDDSHQYTAEKMSMLIERFDKITDLPEPGENVIEISGEADFEDQYLAFQQGVEKFYG